MGDPRVVRTVGHSDRSASELAELLERAGIRRVVDVRSAPWSRRHPWHAKPAMERSLREVGIAYSWLGAELGGLRADGYEAHRETRAYEQGLERLLDALRREPVALLCAERDPAHCHRRFIADDLVRRGVIVEHLIEPGLVLPHQMPLI